MPSLLKQPLFHFLFAGLLIFVFYSMTEQPASTPEMTDKVITVDRNTLLNFMQYRAQAFRSDLFNEQLDAMEEEELQQLVDEFVREEALHREALAMGMDRGDYIIRQRLVQKVEFLLENMVNQSLAPDDQTIAEFLPLTGMITRWTRYTPSPISSLMVMSAAGSRQRQMLNPCWPVSRFPVWHSTMPRVLVIAILSCRTTLSVPGISW